MPEYFLKLPDGKLALFDSAPEEFTAWGMTEEQAIDLGTQKWGRRTAEEKLSRGIDDAALWPGEKPSGDGLHRWRESLETLVLNHTLDAAIAHVAEVGFPASVFHKEALDTARSIAEENAALDIEPANTGSSPRMGG